MSRDHKFSLPPAFQKQLDQVRMIGRLEPFLALLSRFGIGDNRLKTAIAEFKSAREQVRVLAELPGAFHEAFSERGWLVSESTNIETAKTALAAHRNRGADTAEDILAADYEGDGLDFVVTRLCQTRGCKSRKVQLQEALTLTYEARYFAAVPLLLIVADGVGEDVFQKSDLQ